MSESEFGTEKPEVTIVDRHDKRERLGYKMVAIGASIEAPGIALNSTILKKYVIVISNLKIF